MENLRIFYRIEPGTKAAKAADAWRLQCAHFDTACKHIVTKFGANHYWEDGQKFTGFGFAEGQEVPNWLKSKGKGIPPGCYNPHGSSVMAVNARKAIKELPVKWSNDEFSQRFGGDAQIGEIIARPSLRFAGDITIMGIPARLVMPDIVKGCTELYMTEYFQIIETLEKEAENGQ